MQHARMKNEECTSLSLYCFSLVNTVYIHSLITEECHSSCNELHAKQSCFNENELFSIKQFTEMKVIDALSEIHKYAWM